jgi:UDP-N-acetylmuramate dehydrogenase
MLIAAEVIPSVVHVALQGMSFTPINDSITEVRIAAGESWHNTVLRCTEAGLWGIENLALIPGTVGAAPIQNIGAYGAELADVLYEVQAVDITTGKEIHLSHSECRFGYRDSIFKQELQGKVLITEVVLHLSSVAKPNLRYAELARCIEKHAVTPTPSVMASVVSDIRRAKLPNPSEVGNAGSFFKNPEVSIEQARGLLATFPNMPQYPISEGLVKIPAGWLIEQAGWKGKSIGNAGMYHKQALVLVNVTGKASPDELMYVAQAVQADVYKKFNIYLQPEVNIIRN